MFEKLKNITIGGGYFEQPTMINLFKEKQPLSIVYGRNGSFTSKKLLLLKLYDNWSGKTQNSQLKKGMCLI